MLHATQSMLRNIQHTEWGLRQGQKHFFLLNRKDGSVGLEPDRLVALVAGRRGSPLIVSFFFITQKDECIWKRKCKGVEKYGRCEKMIRCEIVVSKKWGVNLLESYSRLKICGHTLDLSGGKSVAWFFPSNLLLFRYKRGISRQMD